MNLEYYMEMAVKSKVDKVKEQLKAMPKDSERDMDDCWFNDLGLKPTDYAPLNKSVETDKYVTLTRLSAISKKAKKSGEAYRGKYASLDALDIFPMMVWRDLTGKDGDFEVQSDDYTNLLDWYRDN